MIGRRQKLEDRIVCDWLLAHHVHKTEKQPLFLVNTRKPNPRSLFFLMLHIIKGSNEIIKCLFFKAKSHKRNTHTQTDTECSKPNAVVI